MALATKCPHCNTIFRVALDQLKLRGGIVRCGACNQVFDGNAALIEPPARGAAETPPPSSSSYSASSPAPAANPAPAPAPIPSAASALTAAPTSYAPAPFDAAMAALDTRAAEVLPPPTEQPYALDLGGHDGADDAPATPAREIDAEAVQAPDIVPDIVPDAPPRAPTTTADLAPAPAPAPTAFEQALELDLDIEAEAPAEPAEAEAPAEPAAAMPAADLSDAPAAPAETAVPAKAAVWRKAAPPPAEAEPQAESAPEQQPLPEREESAPWPEAEPEPEHQPLPERESAPWPERQIAPQAEPAAAPSARQEPELGEPADDIVELQPPATPAPAGAEPADAGADEEPGFVKRDRRNQRVGKAARIVMALGSVLLLAALAAQTVASFRNPLAAHVPALKPALLAICARAGCKVELPSQIDELSIEPGELLTVSETTFSFATQLRNQGRVGQSWPHIELTLNDANDKPVLRRVFTPREYLASQAEVDKGFSPRSEQSVKLYFELAHVKASGYHIAVFYP
ncbi:DUF3426 domain-containing protein [Rugamonas sp. DEMB1]|uniref:DUF3426 domain-containing protein n=1 Tax=Rugamonas sp. DEMB1 TaxID=3039386 RepID=UPI0024475354|nr:DUF3426 domain-containing protein [Rugamonas sp. DEMB1]WGG51218.1 DUF3426 domain-containing protein [Rugamonas sp. DEMB1]